MVKKKKDKKPFDKLLDCKEGKMLKGEDGILCKKPKGKYEPCSYTACPSVFINDKSLTKIQREILKYYSKGWNQSEIARKIGASHQYVNQFLAKLKDTGILSLLELIEEKSKVKTILENEEKALKNEKEHQKLEEEKRQHDKIEPIKRVDKPREESSRPLDSKKGKKDDFVRIKLEGCDCVHLARINGVYRCMRKGMNKRISDNLKMTENLCWRCYYRKPYPKPKVEEIPEPVPLVKIEDMVPSFTMWDGIKRWDTDMTPEEKGWFADWVRAYEKQWRKADPVLYDYLKLKVSCWERDPNRWHFHPRGFWYDPNRPRTIFEPKMNAEDRFKIKYHIAYVESIYNDTMKPYLEWIEEDRKRYLTTHKDDLKFEPYPRYLTCEKLERAILRGAWRHQKLEEELREFQKIEYIKK